MFNSYEKSPTFVKGFIDSTIKHEGKYVNDPKDSGGETNYGITKKVALMYKEYYQQYNWSGDMKTMPMQFAKDLYSYAYFYQPNFNLVAETSLMLSEELFDSGVNVGQGTASKWLQQLLNVLNNQQDYYPDIVEDGRIGSKTASTLKQYLNKRGTVGERVLHNMLNVMQGSHYIQLAAKREKDEKWLWGWFLKRVNFK